MEVPLMVKVRPSILLSPSPVISQHVTKQKEAVVSGMESALLPELVKTVQLFGVAAISVEVAEEQALPVPFCALTS
jgi:hypothetical protein